MQSVMGTVFKRQYKHQDTERYTLRVFHLIVLFLIIAAMNIMHACREMLLQQQRLSHAPYDITPVNAHVRTHDYAPTSAHLPHTKRKSVHYMSSTNTNQILHEGNNEQRYTSFI